MVFDEFRNKLYANALRKLVTPDTVVLDLGAGLGIHGLLAAAAGAKRVYLVEPEPVVQTAREIARANGLEDRIVVLEGKIEEVELPEPVDLIVSVFTGNLLYDEDLLPSLFHARDRYLKPGGKLIPDLAELRLAPVSAPELHAKYISRWSEPHLGLDFSSVRRFAANEVLWPSREEARSSFLLSHGVATASLDLNTATHADCESITRSKIETSGICHGLLGWIRIQLDEHWLSTSPTDPEVHWGNAFLPIDPPVPLEQGEEVELDLRRPAYGDWVWSIKAASGTRIHSSFFGRCDGMRRLRSIAPDHLPGLGQKGEQVLHVLEWMKQGLSIQEIAHRLARTGASGYLDMEDALRQVQSLALRYANVR